MRFDALDEMALRSYLRKYNSASRGYGIVNKLPEPQRKPHYSRICATRNTLRAKINRLREKEQRHHNAMEDYFASYEPDREREMYQSELSDGERAYMNIRTDNARGACEH